MEGPLYLHEHLNNRVTNDTTYTTQCVGKECLQWKDNNGTHFLIVYIIGNMYRPNILKLIGSTLIAWLQRGILVSVNLGKPIGLAEPFCNAFQLLSLCFLLWYVFLYSSYTHVPCRERLLGVH